MDSALAGSQDDASLFWTSVSLPASEPAGDDEDHDQTARTIHLVTRPVSLPAICRCMGLLQHWWGVGRIRVFPERRTGPGVRTHRSASSVHPEGLELDPPGWLGQCHVPRDLGRDDPRQARAGDGRLGPDPHLRRARRAQPPAGATTCATRACDAATSSRCSPTTPPRPTRSTGRRCAPGSTSPRSTTTSPPTRRPTSCGTAARRALIVSAAQGRPGRQALPTGRGARAAGLRRDRSPGSRRTTTALAAADARRRWPSSRTATTSSTPRAPPAGPRASSRRCRDHASTSRATPTSTIFGALYGFDTDTVYLSPAPVYHAAPLRFGGVVHALGGTLVMMERFDAEAALRGDRAAPRHPHPDGADDVRAAAQARPTEVRASYDVSLAAPRRARGGAVPGRGEAAG